MSSAPRLYPMAALIRLTLISLYLALVLPLPLLAPGDLRLWMALAVPAGLVLVLAITSERVELDEQGLRVGHPPWCSWWLQRGWSLRWEAISGLTLVATSQGGRVFYVRSQGPGGGLATMATPGTGPSRQPTASEVDGGDVEAERIKAERIKAEGIKAGSGGRSYLLPQRIAGFEDFLTRFSAASGIDTRSVGRITPPWTYQLLALLSGLLLVAELGMLAIGGFGGFGLPGSETHGWG